MRCNERPLGSCYEGVRVTGAIISRVKLMCQLQLDAKVGAGACQRRPSHFNRELKLTGSHAGIVGI